jgi:hypothetical protein
MLRAVTITDDRCSFNIILLVALLSADLLYVDFYRGFQQIAIMCVLLC